VEGYDANTYGDRIADIYDDRYSLETFERDPGSTIAFLASLAGSGPALELGIGTGRIAIPLKAAGVEVHGIDASEAMVAKLRAKPEGADIPVTLADFRDFTLETRFRLIYIPFNTLWGLLTQEDQVACLKAVARHLSAGGAFVVEAFVPDLSRFDRGQRVQASSVELDELVLETSLHDAAAQRVNAMQVVIREEGIRMFPVRIRYVWPSELDLMAELAGLRLRERWADWERTPFLAGSSKHISVYEPDAD
jgi:ubiquinone/menaquinone biosynthesis C-methylase UbiE